MQEVKEKKKPLLRHQYLKTKMEMKDNNKKGQDYSL